MRGVLLPLLLLLPVHAAGVVLVDEPAPRTVFGAQDDWILWREGASGSYEARLRHRDALTVGHAIEDVAPGSEVLRGALGAGHVAVVTADPSDASVQRPKQLWVAPVDGGTLRLLTTAGFLDGPRGDGEAIVWSTLEDARSLIHRLDATGEVSSFDVSASACLLPVAWPAGPMVAWSEPPVSDCDRYGFRAFWVDEPGVVEDVALEAIALNSGGGALSFVGFNLHDDGWYVLDGGSRGGPVEVVPTTIRPLWGQASAQRFVWLENPEERPEPGRPYAVGSVGVRELPDGEPAFRAEPLRFRSLPVLDGEWLYYNGANQTLEAYRVTEAAAPRGIAGPGAGWLAAIVLTVGLLCRRARCASRQC